MFQEEIENRPIVGIRGIEFRLFIRSLLQRTKLSIKNIDILTNDENIKMYEQAFTHRVVDESFNYEFFELLGDVTCNKIIVWYLKKKFPFLNNSNGVKVIARLRINLVSKVTFSGWAQKLDFQKYISYDLETQMKHEISVLEDCFEAFVGVTELLIDQMVEGGGFYYCNQFLSSIIDEHDISLKYKDLYDPITRLKETFDYFNSLSLKDTCPYIWGTIKFDAQKLEEGGQHVKLLQKYLKREELLLEEKGLALTETKYKLCEKYLDFLKKNGFEKPLPEYYEMVECERKKMYG
jgi:dsRNA-specific ribonuclease